jgi:transposase
VFLVRPHLKSVFCWVHRRKLSGRLFEKCVLMFSKSKKSEKCFQNMKETKLKKKKKIKGGCMVISLSLLIGYKLALHLKKISMRRKFFKKCFVFCFLKTMREQWWN